MFYFIETDKKLIDEAMSTAISASCSYEDEIVKFMRYSALNGKRLRGILTLEFASAFGGTKEEAMPYAVGVECVQAYSLIHDDLPCMDDDDVRRGKPSCHIAFGEANALLAGDALLTHAFSAISESDSAKKHPDRAIKAIEILSKYAGFRGMVAGQVMDLEAAEKVVSAERLAVIHLLKTTALIKAAVLMGCAAAGVCGEPCLLAEKYADCFGSAFQMIDDLLDFKGDYDNCELNSYVKVHGEEKTRKDAYEAINEAKTALSALEKLGYDVKAFYSLLDYLIMRMEK